eukprot:TRINITY_DN43943_c0_g1_i1.p1 TRINITY_DN43943_c0_g1~~TRINITY_DN43943_c0_g1_i1.p1  ORF type:complete len:331 (-),score=69.70 TRINITY_DN43943_c0_g1_i1:118-1110(-)
MLQRNIVRRFASLQLSSLPDASACRTAYLAKDYAACLPAADRVLEIAQHCLPGSKDFVLFSTVAGRCCWRLGLFPAAETHLRAAADVDDQIRCAALRAGAELRPPEDMDGLEEQEWSELNAALKAGAGTQLSKGLTERLLEVSSTEGVNVVGTNLRAVVSAGEAALLGRIKLSAADDVERLLVSALDASLLKSSPTNASLRPRALQSMGTLHFRAKRAVTAEGLFRAAKEAWAEDLGSAESSDDNLAGVPSGTNGGPSPRCVVQRAQGALAYGEFLRAWENREREGDAEVAAAQQLLHGAESVTEEQARWASLVLPPLDVAELIEELWSE